MQTVHFEYGQGVMPAELPDDARIFVPGETVPDPPPLADPIAATKAAIRRPIGMPPISELVKRGSTVTIAFPDRVKGGFHETAHRKVAIPILIEECLRAGVRKDDIRLICATGLHRKNTKEELRSLVGDAVFAEFWPTNQILNQDSEDADDLVDLGYDSDGDRVILNKTLFESDLPILLGHVMGNPYGGYSGGYKMACTGMANWRLIRDVHKADVVLHHDFVPVSGHSTQRKKFNTVGHFMEEKMGKRFFMVDAVLDTKNRQIAVYAGYGEEMQPTSWVEADKRTYVPWAQEKFDIVMFGMPQNFHYGNGHGTNPVLMIQAIGANIVRHKRVLKDNCVVICSSICNGYFHDEEFPSFREVYDLLQRDYNYTIPDIDRYGEYIATRREYVDRYRFKYAYHPYHAFVNLNMGHIAHVHTAATYIVGAYEPGYVRGIGMKPVATFADALRDAERYTGPRPRILALPRAFKVPSVHLMMADETP